MYKEVELGSECQGDLSQVNPKQRVYLQHF